MEILGLLWNEVVIRPMINSLMVLYALLFHNFGLSILAFTALIRLITLPLTLRQLRQTLAMSQIQPKLKDLQKKFEKDRQKMSQETMRLYKEHGVSPLGCLGPMVIQMPILIGLFYAVSQALPATPDSLANLSQKLYSWLDMVNRAVPVNGSFLWMNLASPDRTPVMPVLVGASTWVQQKMQTLPTADPRQQSTNTLMLWMFPLMLAFFTFSFPSGLALYWFVSNLIGVVIQYFVTGWGSLFRSAKAVTAPATEPDKEMVSDGQRGDIGKDSGRGRRAGPPPDGGKPRRGRGKRR